MNMNRIAILTSLFISGAAFGHVAIDPAVAETGTTWAGVVRVGHGCDASPTTGVELKLPAGVTAVRAQAKSGWRVALTPQQVAWTASGKSPGPDDKGDFPLELRVSAPAGAQWITAVQRCGSISAEWAQIPAQGGSTAGMKSPAILLHVLSAPEAAAWRMRPAVENAWVRASVPGQQASGAYMRITAKEPTQLVGVSTPVAGNAEVHEMKMEADVMRMRPAGAVDLPVGKAFELKPGGYHVMLQDLKQPLAAGSSIPLTLVFRNARGVESRTELRVPVSAVAPAGGAAGHGEHKH